MKTRVAATILLLAGILSAPLFAAPADLVPAMAALDKLYIPALGLSGQSAELARARTAFLAFQTVWAGFRERFGVAAGLDAEWPKDLTRIDEAVEEARSALLDHADGPAAHEALEAVRMILLASRTRQRMPYFLDSLTLFHNSMEELLDNTPSRKLAEWSEAEKLGFAADLDIAIARWKKVKAMEDLLPQAGLGAQAAAAYAAQYQTIRSVLEGTKAAFEAGDPAFAGRLQQLKPNFIKTFFLFGDFPK
jgi:hypothetical protein